MNNLVFFNTVNDNMVGKCAVRFVASEFCITGLVSQSVGLFTIIEIGVAEICSLLIGHLLMSCLLCVLGMFLCYLNVASLDSFLLEFRILSCV